MGTSTNSGDATPARPMTSHHYTETATPDATKRYPSDLNDWEFDLIAPQVAQKAGSGKKRTVDIRFS